MSTTPNNNFQAGLGDFGYEPGMALDPKTGRLAVAWYSNGKGHQGVYTATVDQTTGARSGAATRMPETSNLSDGPLGGRTQIVGRPGGGLYVAYEGGYPSHTKVLLWKVGAGSSAELAHDSAGVQSVGLASTPTGRLWIFWESTTRSGNPQIHARRSDTGGQRWGATVNVKPPKGASTIWNMVGSGQPGPLDLLASMTIGSSPKAASWYTQVLPGLTLQASTTRLKTHTAHAQKVTFTVLDAGTPVRGAVVKVDKVSGKTDKAGKVTLALGPFKHKTHLEARTSAGGYTAASLTLKVA
jgi:hypothetical protein